MGYFNSLADAAFKENPDGEGWLYYPNGILGKGRIVTDSAYKDKLFKFQKRVYIFGILFGIIFGLSLDLDNFDISSIVLPSVVIVGIFMRQLWLTKELPISKVKLKYSEATTKAAKGIPKWYIYLLYVLSVLIIVMGVCSPLIFNKPYSETLFLTSILLGMGALGIALGLFVQKFRKNKKNIGHP